MQISRMPSVPERCIVALFSALVLLGVNAHAQARWTVDPRTSLAWWQMNPHMSHLWGTTCPGEPSWRPGEERSAAWFMKRWSGGPSSASDTVHVPLYPRYEARDVCAEAVRGEVVAPDTVTWRGLRGEVTVKADLLTSGQSQRDAYTRETVLEIQKYPEIRFAIDSLVSVTRQADTLSGSAVGEFSLHGVTKPMVAAVRVWHEGGGLRVVGKFRIPARSMVQEYGLSSRALGLGVGVRIWQELFMGVDLLLRSVEAPDS
jgi:polyisoprenoid-binding protein YceI